MNISIKMGGIFLVIAAILMLTRMIPVMANIPAGYYYAGYRQFNGMVSLSRHGPGSFSLILHRVFGAVQNFGR